MNVYIVFNVPLKENSVNNKNNIVESEYHTSEVIRLLYRCVQNSDYRMYHLTFTLKV